MMRTAAIAISVVLASCATDPPECPTAEVVVLSTTDGRVYLAFDIETMAHWNDTIRREARGECRFPTKGMSL